MRYRKSEAKEASRAQFRGVWAAITAPFTPDDKLDEAGLRRNMRHEEREAIRADLEQAGLLARLLAARAA